MSLFLQAVLLNDEFIVAFFDFICGWVLRAEVVLLLLDGLILLLIERKYVNGLLGHVRVRLLASQLLVIRLHCSSFCPYVRRHQANLSLLNRLRVFTGPL